MSIFWNKYNARKRALEEKYTGVIYRALRGQYNAFLNAIKEHGYDYAKANLNQLIPLAPMGEAIKKVYRAGAWIESRYVYSYLAGEQNIQLKRRGGDPPVFGVGFDEIATVVDDYFQIYLFNKAILPISETTKKQIRERLISEVDSGVPLEEAIRNFREYALTSGDNPHNVVSRLRAKTIIETESLKALNFGGMIGAYMSGVPLTDLDKVWVTCEDERVRKGQFPHTRLDRQVTNFFGSFYNNEPIKFPGDPEASAGNTINCRCTVFFKKRTFQREPRNILNFLSEFMIGFSLGQVVGDFLSNIIEDNG